MKIKRLELKAFGPFTERSLDFSSPLPGLHVVYGPNEAGKSSSLRALQALLFGFETSGDNFLHPYGQFLVGGTLQGSDGRELTFYRRKKTKNSLFDGQDQALDPVALQPFLSGLEKDGFSTLYGIDHATLVQGGQGILEQQGEVGQALFAAGSGLASLKTIGEALEKEGDDLFRPRGSSQAISVALAEYRELQAQIKQLSLSSRDWQEHRRILDEAEKNRQVANGARGQLSREKHQLERLRQALPYLGQRRSLLEKLAALGAVVELPADFGERRRQLEQQRRDLRLRIEANAARLRELREKSRGISLNQGVLDHAEAIETLHQGLEKYRSGNDDRLQLEGRRIGCRTEAANLLRQIRSGDSLDTVELLRPSLAKRKTIQALATRHEAIAQAVRLAGRLAQTTGEELTNTRHELQQLPQVAGIDELAVVVTAARKNGDLDGAVAGKGQTLAALRQDCSAALQRLGLWHGQLEQVVQLALPLPETLRRFEEEFRVREEERRQFVLARGQLAGELAQLEEQRQEIEYAAEVPTEEELGRHRKRRDQGWQLLRRQWLQGEELAAEARDFDPEQPLPEAYEKLVVIADQTADRLYREADRVQKHAALKARGDGLARRLAELGNQEAGAELAQAEAERDWRGLWAPCAISPLSPREMQAWLNGFEKLRFQMLEVAKVAAELVELAARRSEARAKLLAALLAGGAPADFPGEELAPVLRFAEAQVQRAQGELARGERLAGKCRDLEKALETATREQAEAEEEGRRWQASWDEAVAPLGLSGRVLPAEALDFLDTLRTCFDKLQEADGFRRRIEGIVRDASQFEAQLVALAKDIAPELLGLETSQAVAQLKGRLARASQEQAVLRQYGEEGEALDKASGESVRELALCEEQLLGMRRQAGCAGEEQLDEAERCSGEYLKLRERLAEVEVGLARIGEGVSVADLEEQARGLDPDALPGRIADLSTEIEGRLDPEVRHWSETIGREKNELARMDGSGRAEELAEAAQQVLARIRRLSERYIRVKLAGRLLRDEIERYRAENQDPVLKIAARYFRQLTLDSLTDLRSDFDEQGHPVLVGVRANGAWLPVAGMSSGTRDQLYLSLRLASLEWRLQAHEPVPFIVDDILINFDDARSLATLRAFAELGQKNQVILFTHHGQVLRAAQELIGGGDVLVHQL